MQQPFSAGVKGDAPRAARTLPPIGPDRHEIGRQIGFDLYTHGRASDAADWPAEIGEGWRHASAERRRTHPPDRHER